MDKTTKPKAKPLNIKQERFAEFVAAGKTAVQAYIAAGYSGNGRNAEANACRLVEHDGVQALIKKLRGMQTRANLLSKDEKRAFLAEVIRTPIGQIGPMSPLCQEFTEDIIGGGKRGKLKRGQAPSGNETEEIPITRRRIKMQDKLKAIELDSKLAGHFAPEEVIVETGPKTLESLEQRARDVASALDRRAVAMGQK